MCVCVCACECVCVRVRVQVNVSKQDTFVLQALLKNVTPDANGRETNDSCRGDFTSCPDSRTAGIVRQYAMNNTRWHEDFGPAFQILMEHGYPDNYLVAAVTAPETPATSPAPSVRLTTDMGTPDSALATKGAFLMVVLGAILSLLL